jgi:CHAD domain-containing protein
MTQPPAAIEVRRAEPVVLDPQCTLSTAFLTIERECIEHWQGNLEGVLTYRNMSSLHQLRVGVRRFRSAISLLRRGLEDPSRLRWISTEIRDLALPFGEARDLDVLLAGDWVASLDDDQVRDLTSQREAAYEVTIAVLSSTRWSDAWAHTERFLAAAPWSLDPDPPAVDVAGAALERRWRRVARTGADLAAISPADRHWVRIEAKKLRYGCQFFADLYAGAPGTPPADFADALGELQDALGALNDAVTAREILGRVGAADLVPDHVDGVAAAQTVLDEVSALEPFWR